MRSLSQFRAPEPNLVVISLCQFLIPVYSRYIEHFTCEFHDRNSTVKALKNKRTIILLNHSDRQDPSVVVFLAKYLQEQIHCMVAREVFDWYHGILGWFFQKFGCYSVNRGAGDMASIETTKEILRQGKHKLVVFPEAEITGDDRTVHNISTALVHLILEIQEEVSQVDGACLEPSASDSAQTLWVLPVGVGYRLETVLEPSVDKALRAIERALKLVSSGSEIDKRISRATEELFHNLARHYRFTLDESEAMSERAYHLADHICQRIADFIGTEITHKTPEQMQYSLRNNIDEKFALSKTGGSHQARLEKGAFQIYREFNIDLNRVENLLIFNRVLQQPASPIQICRIVDFLEIETIGRISSKGRQVASVFFGEPIAVSSYLPSFGENKHAAIADLKSTIHKQLQLALDCSNSPGASTQGSPP
ncbi:hypothetical protein BH11CYA1_BH11CYA1_07630 [soil metagenome]